MNKSLMIQRGYVPATCALHEDLAAPLIMHELSAGRDPCAGCNLDRKICGGRSNTVNGDITFRDNTEKWALEKRLRDAILGSDEILIDDRKVIRGPDGKYRYEDVFDLDEELP